MKTSLCMWIASCWAILAACAGNGFAQGAPLARGKMLLVIDKTMMADSVVRAKIDRLDLDLTCDGWRVLHHEVERSPESQGSEAGMYERWVAVNARQVREVRALIKADYDASKGSIGGELKAVLILGHAPVPYSGDSADIVGQHLNYQGAHPADSFYGELIGQYGPGGWSDLTIDNLPPFIPNSTIRRWADWRRVGDAGWPARNEIVNTPGDGKFDQNRLPHPMSVAVGRVDFGSMPIFGESEAAMLAQYLDKNHDFRAGLLQVRNRALLAMQQTLFEPFIASTNGLLRIFETNSVLMVHDPAMHWFPYTQGEGQDFLYGYGGGYGTVNAIQCIGGAGSSYGYDYPGIYAVTNNFVDNDSRVVFLNFYSSYNGDWDQKDNVLRAALANPYEPPRRMGLGLAVVWGNYGMSEAISAQRALGATWGESLFDGYSGDVHVALLGDPTLRLHNHLLPPEGLTVAITESNTCVLEWTKPAGAPVTGYLILRAPAKSGPFEIVHTNEADQVRCELPRAESDTPDNFYMVRSMGEATTPAGVCTNLGLGSIAGVPSVTPWLRILQQPASQNVIADTGDGVTNAAVFAIDAAGIGADGIETVEYRWCRNGLPITDSDVAEDPRIQGIYQRALSIQGVRAADNGDEFSVIVTLVGSSISSTSSVSRLTVSPGLPVISPLTFTTDEGIPIDIDILSKASSPVIDPASVRWNILSIGCASLPDSILPKNGTASIISVDGRQRIRYSPRLGYYSPDGSPDTFQVVISDGFGSSMALVRVYVRDVSVKKNLQRYGLEGKALGTWTYASGYHFEPAGNSRELGNGDFELNLTKALPGDKGEASGYFEGSRIRGDFERTINIASLNSSDGAAGLIVRQHIDPPAGSEGKDGMFDLFVFVGVAHSPLQDRPGFYCAAQIKPPAYVNGWWDTPHYWIPASLEYPHAWVKLCREGNQITVSVSADGRSWSYTGVFVIPLLADEIDLGCYVHQGRFGEIGRAVFRPLKLAAVSDTGGQRSLNVTGPAGIPCLVETTSDWSRWNRLATVILDPVEGQPDLGQTAIPLPGENRSNAYYRASFGSYRSVNAAGFAGLDLPARESLIVNPLNALDNRISALFAVLPEGSILRKYTAIGAAKSAVKSGGIWAPFDWTLNGGEGAVITLPSETPVPVHLSFAGEVVQPGLVSTIPPGAPIWNNSQPQANGLAAADNLIAPESGGRLLSFTSEHDDAWSARKITDGILSGPGGSWTSWTRDRVGANVGPQEFVYGFARDRKAVLTGIVFHNYGEDGDFYSRGFEVHASLDGQTWGLCLRGELEAREGPQAFALDQIACRYLKLSITSGYDTYCMQLGELRVLGGLVADNLIRPSNGGMLAAGIPARGSEWGADKLTDGIVSGEGACWVSQENPEPVSFVYSFSESRAAALESMTVHNYGGTSNAFSKSFQVFTSMDSNTWVLRASGDLLPQEGPQIIPLHEVPARYVKLSILSGYSNECWMLGEVVLSGSFDVTPLDPAASAEANLAAYAALDAGKPDATLNVVPCVPDGWENSLWIGTSRGDPLDASSLTASNRLFLSWAVVNKGDEPVAIPFFVDLYLDSNWIRTWRCDPPLAPGKTIVCESFGIGALPVGVHAIRLSVKSPYAEAGYADTEMECIRSIVVGGEPLRFEVVSSAGSHGHIEPATTLALDHSTSLAFTAHPDEGYRVDQWYVNGASRQAGGSEFFLDNVSAPAEVLVTFRTPPTRLLNLSGDIAFGEVTTNRTATALLAVANRGDSTLTVSEIVFPPGFSGNWVGAIKAGETQKVVVTFSPISLIGYEGGVTVVSDATAGSGEIRISGVGAVEPVTRILVVNDLLAFGNVVTNTTSVANLMLANAGNTELTIDSIDFPAGFSGDWAARIGPGETRNIQVTFTPESLDAYDGLIVIHSDATIGASSVRISGAGCPEPPKKILLLSGNIVFGDVPAGRQAFAILTLANAGDASLTVSNIDYPPGFSGDWSGTINPGELHEVTVAFSPAGITNYGGKLLVVSDATSGANRIYVSGAGVPPPPERILLLSGNMNYGSVPTNRTSYASLFLMNDGNAPLTITGIAYPDGFSGDWTGVIAAGGFHELKIGFQPAALTNYGGKVTITSDATGGSNSIYLSGTGAEAIGIEPPVEPGAAGGKVRIRLSGVAGSTYVIQSSPDLKAWANVGTNTASMSGTIEIIDPKAGASDRLFFRAVPVD